MSCRVRIRNWGARWGNWRRIWGDKKMLMMRCWMCWSN